MEETKKCKKKVRLPWKKKDFLTITSFLPWKTTKRQEITHVFHGRHKKKKQRTFIWEREKGKKVKNDLVNQSVCKVYLHLWNKICNFATQ